jgi:hypothetical protein
MKKLYIFFSLLLIALQLAAQDCSTLQFTTAVTESRCFATGSINVTASGGSGSYNYRVIGPVTKPFTSANLITGLQAGYYKVIVKDVNTNCTKEKDSVYVPGTYQDPRFQLTKQNVTCLGNDGSIQVINQQYGRAPFTYTIISPSASSVGTTNTSGNFAGLIPGEYYVQLKDSCGGIQVRRITIENYNWWFDSVSVVRLGCDSASAFIRLRNNSNELNTIGSAFAGFTYGVTLTASDTTWFNTNSFNFYIGKKRFATIVVKDNCGNIKSYFWVLPNDQRPAIGTPALTNFACSTFTATVTGAQNLTNPQYCLFNASNDTIACNSTGVFNNIPYGDYCIRAIDICYDTVITRCFTAARPVPSVDPDALITNQTCSTFTASITGWSNLYNPNFCLYVDGDTTALACNTTGTFTNIPYGQYCIQVVDGCDSTTITICFKPVRPIPVLNPVNIGGVNCNTFNAGTGGGGIGAQYCLYDSLGNIITCNSTGVFDSLPHGNYCIRAITNCGDTTQPVCFSSTRPRPSVAANVSISNRTCTGFTATVTGQQNLTNPQYCLVNNVGDTVTCNTTGVFANIPYGSYCIAIKDGCYDTTITRCFTQNRAVPSVNATLQITGSTCNTVSFRANGTNLTSPTYCLYDSLNNQVACNTTGIFNNMPWGRYCVQVANGCNDTTFTVCQTFNAPYKITLSTSKSCNIGNANVTTQFESPRSPYTIKYYHPNGSLLQTVTTSTNPYTIVLPALPAGLSYKIVASDNCGRTDSALIVPDATIVTKNTSVNKKCPTATWVNGSGDIVSSCSSNFYAVLPTIIKKNGANYVRSFSSVSGNIYTFADLEPATYVVEYTLQTCNTKLYDTVTVSPYTYPSQGQSAIYQCDNAGFSLGANVQGGISPYTYQIIGSTPDTPSLIATQVNNPVFTINNGTTYSLIRLRVIDVCGNATLDDVSVLPLQNFAITASDSCFYRDITLTVDTVPNATYTWYRKTTPYDSVLLGTGSNYNLPFFRPEEIGTYVCKISVNNGCLVRLAYFVLDGDCGQVFLPNTIQLKAKAINGGNQLKWMAHEESGILYYEVEKQTGNLFTKIGNVSPRNSGATSVYYFVDNYPNNINHYRIKRIKANGNIDYSNVVTLKSGSSVVEVYPNPVKDRINISIASDKAADYSIQLINATGQLIFSKELKAIKETTIGYNRHKENGGVYFLRVINKTTNQTDVQKLILE